MELSLSKNELKAFVAAQLAHMLPDKYAFKGQDVNKALELALERLEFCFKHITVTGYSKGTNSYFYHLHSDQYSQFLYYLANSLWQVSENRILCDKLILLNRILHSIWYSYKGGLPAIFLLAHPVGSVLGNADYSNFLVVFQNVTINTNVNQSGERAPVLGKGLFLGAGAKIIGSKEIGARVSIGNVTVFNRGIPDDHIVFQDERGHIRIEASKKVCAAQKYFNVKI